MNCKDFKQYISKYIDKELPSSTEDEFKEHLEKCQECRKEYLKLQEAHNMLNELFTEKELPMGLETRIINNLPEGKSRFNFKGIFFKKKTLGFLIPILLICILLPVIYKLKNGGLNAPHKMDAKSSLVALVRVNNTTYIMSSNEVITDERIIDREIGVIKSRLNDEKGKFEDNSPWTSSIADAGTKVYSIKGISHKEAIALKINGQWEIFRVMNSLKQDHPIFTEDMLKAEKFVIREIGKGKDSVKEIRDKETINKIALYIKNSEKVSGITSYFEGGKQYQYYFVIRDSNGIGKISYKYFFTMQDINFNGYIDTRENDSYKTSIEFNKLITGPFGSIPSAYDEKLGGKQQIYEVQLSPKIIFRKLIKEAADTKNEIDLLNEGESIWNNGSQIKDNLKGKYKLQVIMKDTTIQKNILEKAIADAKVPGAVSIKFTEGSTKDTLVMYIGFDTKPDYFVSDSGDCFVIEIKD